MTQPYTGYKPTKTHKIITQTYLAYRAGVSPRTMQRWMEECPFPVNLYNALSVIQFVIWLHTTKDFNP